MTHFCWFSQETQRNEDDDDDDEDDEDDQSNVCYYRAKKLSKLE